MPWGDWDDGKPFEQVKRSNKTVEVAPVVEPKRMLRYNGGKPPLSLLPTSLIFAISKDTGLPGMPTLLLDDTAQVLGFGARKYDAENWRKAGPWKEVLDCALRHLHKMFRGETHDEESGVHHAAHVACNLGFLLEFIAVGDGQDDRYNEPRVSHKAPPPDTLAEVYDLLLLWKDGAEHAALIAATQSLSRWYEDLPPEVRAMRFGTSEYAYIQKGSNGTVS